MSRVVTNEEKTYVNLHRTVPLSDGILLTAVVGIDYNSLQADSII